MWCMEQCPREGGFPLGSVPQGALGQCRSHLRVSLSRTRELGHVHLCTPHSQVKGFPRRPELLSTLGAPVVGKVDSGSLRAVVPQSDPGAGCWSEGTWELVSTVDGH